MASRPPVSTKKKQNGTMSPGTNTAGVWTGGHYAALLGYTGPVTGGFYKTYQM